MSEPQDPERLLADALRAQARNAPPVEAVPEPPPSQLPSVYGLLSGTEASSLERERAALEPPTVRHPVVRPKVLSGPIPAYWILLLAALLGLATGSVIGLITLL